MKNILFVILAFSLILSNGCSPNNTTEIEAIEYIDGLPNDVWFPGVAANSIFVSTEAITVSGIRPETTYAFLKILDTGRIISAKYIKKDSSDKIVSATRDETIAYAKSITSTLEDFTVDIPEKPAVPETPAKPDTGENWKPGSPAIPAYTIMRKLNLNGSKYRIINKPYVYNSEKVYDYYCSFQISSISGEMERSYVSIIANITSDKIRVFELQSSVGARSNFYYKEGSDAVNKGLANYESEITIISSYQRATEFTLAP